MQIRILIVFLDLFIFHFFVTGEEFLDGDDIGLRDSSAVLTPEQRDIGGIEVEEEKEEDNREEKMGVGKNTTSKSMDSSSEGGKYEEEVKHGADFYPIPVDITHLQNLEQMRYAGLIAQLQFFCFLLNPIHKKIHMVEF